MKRGLLIVYTGAGKGKTTAAFGLALRALGHGMRVGVVQFIKGRWPTGELAAAAAFPDLLDCHVRGRGFTWQSANLAEDIRVAQEAWRFARDLLAANRHALIILDELTYLMKYKMVATEDIVAALQARPAGMHVVVTGRDAPPELIAAADIATDMQALKHAYAAGVDAQPGIEF